MMYTFHHFPYFQCQMLKVISLFLESTQKMQKALLTDKTTKKRAFFHDFNLFGDLASETLDSKLIDF